MNVGEYLLRDGAQAAKAAAAVPHGSWASALGASLDLPGA